MQLQDIVQKLGLDVHTAAGRLGRAVHRGYASDILSDVMAHARPGDLWVTLQTHVNTVAVAELKELAAIVLAGGRRPDPETLEKAAQREIPLLSSPLPKFELVGRLYQLGLRGGQEP
jgi:hypothetical protein